MCYGHARFVAGTDSCNRSITPARFLLSFFHPLLRILELTINSLQNPSLARSTHQMLVSRKRNVTRNDENFHTLPGFRFLNFVNREEKFPREFPSRDKSKRQSHFPGQPLDAQARRIGLLGFISGAAFELFIRGTIK